MGGFGGEDGLSGGRGGLVGLWFCLSGIGKRGGLGCVEGVIERGCLLPESFALPIDPLKVAGLGAFYLGAFCPAGMPWGHRRSPRWRLADGGGLGAAVGGAGGSPAVPLVGGALGGIGKGDLVAWREHVTVMSTAIGRFRAMEQRMVI